MEKHKNPEVPEEPKVNDIPEPGVENVESSKLEWGPELGQMSWNKAQEKIAELNAGLTEGEKKWRLPTSDELVDEFKKTNDTPDNFHSNRYWSANTNPHHPEDARYVDMSFGTGYYDSKDGPAVHVRCVRKK